jgi:uncharacterized protein DUF6990
MREIDMFPILKNEGWTVEQDEVGDDFCTMIVGALLLQIIPTIKKRSDHFRLSLMPSVSSVGFSQAVNHICNRTIGYSPIIVSNFAPEKIVSPSSKDVTKLSKQAVDWAKEQDINIGLLKYKELPTNAKGAMPLRHLAALSLAGDVDKLKSYQDSFKRGDRVGFVPYISCEMIGRAIEIAQIKQG